MQPQGANPAPPSPAPSRMPAGPGNARQPAARAHRPLPRLRNQHRCGGAWAAAAPGWRGCGGTVGTGRVHWCCAMLQPCVPARQLPCPALPLPPAALDTHTGTPTPAAEGDAFHVAFKDVQAAALFCMEVQYQVGGAVGKLGGQLGGRRAQAPRLVSPRRPRRGSPPALEAPSSHRSAAPSARPTPTTSLPSPPPWQMMELEWPREVLRLGPCKEVKAPDGSLVYRCGCGSGQAVGPAGWAGGVLCLL